MLAIVEIAWWHWAGFVLLVLVFLALDVGVFHRRAHVVRLKEALAWTALWVALAMAFYWALHPWRGTEAADQFLLGYVIEKSLSMDNVFVMVVIFQYFQAPAQYQHRVLFCGILGALIMRGLMIWLGAELVAQYEWILYIFGVFLILTGIKMLIPGEEELHPERNLVLRLARKYFRVAPRYDGQNFFTHDRGRRALTLLAIVLLMVESMDLVFALDSIPAIFIVTQDPFIVFTSNVFAILGLRSLYFVLAGAIAYFRHLKYGLAVVLAFIGFKMVISDWVHISPKWSLAVVAGILATAAVCSVVATKRKRGPSRDGQAPPSPNRAGGLTPAQAGHAAAPVQPAQAIHHQALPQPAQAGELAPPIHSTQAVQHQAYPQPAQAGPPALPIHRPHEPLSENLLAVLSAERPPGGLTLNRVLFWTEGRGIFLLVVLLCFPFLAGSIPGTSTILGTAILLLALQLAFRLRPQLPGWLGERPLPPGFDKVLAGSVKVLRFLERWLVRPRRSKWLNWPPVRCFNALVLGLMAFCLALPLAIPLTNMLPAYAILLVALSMMEADGAMIWAGYAVSVGTLVYFYAWADVIMHLAHQYCAPVLHWLQHWL
jgi:tellurite resistance protein TerC